MESNKRTMQNTKFIEKEFRFVVARGRGKGVLKKDGKKAQTFSCELSKYEECSVHVVTTVTQLYDIQEVV